jgi:hypothetical protein
MFNGNGPTLDEEEIRERVHKARNSNLPGEVGDEVTPRKLQWFWPRRIPRGRPFEICGDPGNIKSGIVIDLAARVTTGRPFRGELEESEREPGNVLFFSSEDDIEDTLVPRFIAAGGELSRIRFVTAIHGDALHLPDDGKKLEGWVKDWRPALLVLDPLDAYFGKVDPNKNPEVRRALLPLFRLGGTTGLTTGLIRHLNKDTQTGRAMYRSAGSIAVTAACRASYVVAPKPDDPATFVLACTKLNGGRIPPSLSYQIVEEILPGDIHTQRINWLNTVNETADDLVREPAGASGPRGPKGTKTEAAKQFLREILANGVELDSGKIEELGKAKNISSTTVWAASKELNVKRRKAGFAGGWLWSLPPEGDRK